MICLQMWLTLVFNCAQRTKLCAVERQPVRWENCAKPVLYAGAVI